MVVTAGPPRPGRRWRAAAALLALLWPCAVLAFDGAPWPVLRVHALLPALLLLTCAARGAPARIGLAFGAFAAAWLAFGAAARWQAGAGSLLACLQAAAHERVWLEAAGIGVLGWLHGAVTGARPHGNDRSGRCWA